MRQWIRPRAAYFTRILSSRGKPIRHADRRRTNGIFFFFRISAPYLWAVSKTFRWDFTGEFISAVSLYLFLSPFFFFFFFTFSFGQVYQRQTDKFVCRGTMMLRMNDNRFLRITCFAKCTRIILFVQTNGKSFPKSTDDRSFPLQIITRLYALENI